MVFDRLREACKQDHLSVKQGYYAGLIMSGSLGLAQYTNLLLANFWFHGHIEWLMENALPDSWKQELAWKDRLKTPFLLKDLEELGFFSESLPYCPQEFTIANPVEALGVLYVTEGTAIGGAIIRKNLLNNRQIVEKSQINFYGCYGKALSPLWKQYAKVVNKIEGNEALEELVIDKAKATFSFYENLLVEAEDYHQQPILTL